MIEYWKEFINICKLYILKMGLDYYKILGVSKSASKVEICQAYPYCDHRYKELALRYHPSLKHNNEN